jgi:glycosyltransferase involved in cell wall biosynthesis
MVTTESMVNFLQEKKFNNLSAWARGVDISQFHPDKRFKPKDVYEGIKRPIFVNIGRVAVEKNIEAFLKIDLPGSKVVVGDGPQLNYLKEKYPETHFLGAKFGDELSRHFADADVFVFPSKTDTFGLVIIESMATGTPVAAYPVTGPVDIIPNSKAGSINEDLRVACISCLELDRNDAVTHAEKFSWDAVSEVFYNYLTPNYKPKHQKHMFLISYVLKLILFPYNLLKK